MSAVQQPLLDTIEADEDAPEPVKPSKSKANTRQPVVLTPTQHATEGAMASTQSDAEAGK
jgi:hypothetical protein